MSHHAPSAPTVTVALAASHPGVRDSLRVLLGHDGRIDLAAVVADARGAARCLLQHHPDVLMVALAGALNEDGALIRRLRALSPRTAVVLATTATGEAYRSVAGAAGAVAVVALDGPTEDLLSAVHAAAGAPGS